jgi:hypothetical protein
MKRTVAVCVAVVLCALLATPETVAAQCAMCRRALDSPEGQQLIGALRRGILLLLAAPFLLFGVIAVLAVRVQRRSRPRPSETA